MVWGVCHVMEMNIPPCATGKLCQSCRTEARWGLKGLFMQHHSKSCSTVSTDGKNLFISSRKAHILCQLMWPQALGGSPEFTTPSASGVRKHRATWVYRWRDWMLLTGLLCLEKLQSIKFDLYRQRYMLAERMKATWFKFLIRVNGETKAALMSEWVMQCLSKDFYQCYVAKYMLFSNFCFLLLKTLIEIFCFDC